MKFFSTPPYPTTLISNYCWENWAYPYDVPSILESSHPLYYLYSKHHNQHPKNVDPNNVSSRWGIPAVNDENCDLSTSLPKRLCSRREDTQHEYEHGLCSQHLLKYSHSLNYKSELANHDSVSAHHLAKHDTDIWLSKQYVHLNDLYYVNYSCILTWSENIKFIETKVAAINCGVLTFN
jgi:hypothetical protein